MENDEKKWRKRVNRNGWMVKLHKLCFGDKTPHFNGFCPFFWFTWFCLLISPVWLPLRAAWWLLCVFFGLFAKIIAAIPRKPPWENDGILLNFYDNYYPRGLQFCLGLPKPFCDIAWWATTNYGWETKVAEARARLQEQQESEARRAARADQHRRKLGKFANRLGLIAKPIVIAILIFGTYWAGKFLWFLILQITWARFILGLKLTGGAILVAILILSIAKSIQLLFRWIVRRRAKRTGDGWFVTAVEQILNPIGKTAEFLGDTISAIYTRECPLIEWGEENGRIERNT